MAALNIVQMTDSHACDLSGTRAQARMDVMMDATNLSVKILETDGKIIRENDMSRSHFGAGDHKGLHWELLWPAPVREAIVSAISSSADGLTVRLEHKRVDGSGVSRLWAAVLAPITYGPDDITAIIVVSHPQSANQPV